MVFDGAVQAASVRIEDGIVESIGEFDDVRPGEEVVECGDRVLMAGLVDSHVHVNEPGRTEWEGFRTATRAAAAGGITTIVDMPLNSIPATTSVESMKLKVEALTGNSHVDVGLWGGAVPGNGDQLLPMLAAGALGFKCFLIDSGVPEFGHLDEEGLGSALQLLRESGAPLLVHAELPGPIEEARPEGDRRSYRHYLQSRPDAAEITAIELVVRKCEETGGRAHIVHLSAAVGLKALQDARERGLNLSAETTPHYLHFVAEQVPDGATEFKCAPPIREAANREALWGGLRDGLLELVVSDHSPCTAALKSRDSGDFMSAWGGIASLQFLLPVIWTEARARGYALPVLEEWLSRAPAELAGLHRVKGRLAVGLDADLVVWDPEAVFEPRASMIEHRHKLTPYLGESLYGVVTDTFVRGKKVFDRGSFAPASGRWLQGRGV